MKLIKKKQKNLILKLDCYRKFIRTTKLLNFYKQKNNLFVVCHSVFFGGYSLKLLKEYFCSKVFEFYNYKDNFQFMFFKKHTENYLYNYKIQKPLNKSILFFFKNFNEIYLFFYKIRTLTLSPYFFYPLYIITEKKSKLLTFDIFYNYLQSYKYKYNANSFLYYIYINIIQKAICIIFIFITLQIVKKTNFVKCQL